MHASVVFPPRLAIYGRSPDLSLTACVSQIRSVSCIQAMDVPGPSAKLCAPANENPRVQPNVLQVPGIRDPWSRIFCSFNTAQRGFAISGPRRICLKRPWIRHKQAPFWSQRRTFFRSLNTIDTPRSATDLGGFWCSTSSHLFLRLVHTIPDDHHRMFSHHRH